MTSDTSETLRTRLARNRLSWSPWVVKRPATRACLGSTVNWAPLWGASSYVKSAGEGEWLPRQQKNFGGSHPVASPYRLGAHLPVFWIRLDPGAALG